MKFQKFNEYHIYNSNHKYYSQLIRKHFQFKSNTTDFVSVCLLQSWTIYYFIFQ